MCKNPFAISSTKAVEASRQTFWRCVRSEALPRFVSSLQRAPALYYELPERSSSFARAIWSAAVFLLAFPCLAPGAVGTTGRNPGPVADCLHTIRSLCLGPAILNADQGKRLEDCFLELKKSDPSPEDVREAAVFLVYRTARDYWQLRSFFVDLSKLPLAPKMDRVLKLDRGQLGRTYKLLMKVGQGLVMARPLAENLPSEFTSEESWETIEGHLPLLAPGHSQPTLADLWNSFVTLLERPMAQSETKYQQLLSRIQAAWQQPENLGTQPEEVIQFVKVYGRIRMYYRRFAGLSGPK